jgi:hypothetical protein
MGNGTSFIDLTGKMACVIEKIDAKRQIESVRFGR